MTLETIAQKLCEVSVTKGAVHRRISLLRSYLEDKFFGKGQQSSTIVEYAAAHTENADDAHAVAGLGEEGLRVFTKEHLYEQLNAISEYINTYKNIQIYIPVDLNNREIGEIGSWVREHIFAKTLLDVHVDPTMSGGCVIVWDGRSYDYSLASRFLHIQDRIGDLLHAYDQSTQAS